MKHKNLFVFILFFIVLFADALFTCIGIRNGILEEANFFINFLALFFSINIYYAIATMKLVSIFFVYWILFVLPKKLQEESIRKRVVWKIWLREDIPRKTILILIFITALFGVVPGLIINFNFFTN